PGDPVRFGSGDRDIPLVVDQGIDDRKPLLSLFLTRRGEWVGWSPQGPYDFSVKAAEDLVGWHKNTGRAERPVEFQKAEVYRKEFHPPGLLGHAIPRASAEGPRAKPALTASIGEMGR